MPIPLNSSRSSVFGKRAGRQRGFLIVEVGLALLIALAAGAAAFVASQHATDATNASTQADTLKFYRDAAETLVYEQYDKFQESLPITRNGVTLAPGAGAGQTFQPTTANLKAMALGVDNAAEQGFYKSLANSNYQINIQLTPAGCNAAPNPVTGVNCDVKGTVCFTQAVQPYGVAAAETDGFGIGKMLGRLGGNGGLSIEGNAGQIIGSGGGWAEPNPIAGTPAGIVCTRFGFGSSGWARFLRVQDKRDPDFQGGATISGTVPLSSDTFIVNGSSTINGTATIAGNATVRDSLTIQGTGTVGGACSLDASMVQGTIAGFPVILKCVAGLYAPTGLQVGIAGGGCPNEGQIAQTIGGSNIVCSGGIYRPINDLLGTKGMMDVGLYSNGQVVPAPVCGPSMTPLLVPMGVVSACVVGGGTCPNNTGSFRGSVDGAGVVSITGSNGSLAGSAQLTVASICSTT